MRLEVVLVSAFVCDLEKVMNSEVSSFVGDITSFKQSNCADGGKISLPEGLQ